MNLKSLFNVNYLLQNIKKSRSFLAFFLGFIPILNVLIIILNSSNRVYIPSFDELSILNYIGMYILPIVISICLFGYVFKKKSVDFVNSMPISRKSIFITNTIGGIGLIIFLNLINALLIFILSIVLSNVVIPIKMILDYFLIWSLIYTFVYVCSNIAVSICGNMITSIALTLLIMFLIPFIHSYVSVKDLYFNDNSYELKCYDCNYSINVEPAIEYNYTAPYNSIISGVGNSENTLITNKSIIKMLILSIVYIIIGYVLFIRRKMEVSETSFKSIHVHNTIKCLTMIPFVVIFYEVSRDANISTVMILLCIMFGYYLIFDLITRKNISKFGIGCIYFICFMIIANIILSIINIDFNRTNKVLKMEDIKSMEVNNYKYNNIYTYNDNYKNIEIKDKEVIKKSLNIDICNSYGDASIVMKDNSKYNARVCRDNIDNLDINIDFNDFYVASINKYIVLDKSVIKKIENAMNTFKDNNDFKYNDNVITLYSYKDRKLIKYDFNYKISKEIEELYVNSINKYIKNNIDNINFYNISLDDHYYSDCVSENNDCSYMENTYMSGDYYNEIRNLIKADNKIDINKDYVILDISTDNGEISYATNKVDLVKRFLND